MQVYKILFRPTKDKSELFKASLYASLYYLNVAILIYFDPKTYWCRHCQVSLGIQEITL